MLVFDQSSAQLIGSHNRVLTQFLQDFLEVIEYARCNPLASRLSMVGEKKTDATLSHIAKDGDPQRPAAGQRLAGQQPFSG